MRLGAEYTAVEGVGLALSRRLVQAVNGAIGYESEERTGSRFWIDLPTEPAEATADTATEPDAAAVGVGPDGYPLLYPAARSKRGED